MKTKFFITLLVTLLCWSCTSEEPVFKTPASRQTTMPSRYLSPDEACDIARKTLFEMGFSNASRSNKNAVAYLYNSTMSRSLTTDSLLYIVNFTEGGYAVVLADRAAKVNTLAISETGTFEEDINPASEDYMDRMIGRIDSTRLSVNPKYPLKPILSNPDPYIYDKDGFRTEIITDIFEHKNYLPVTWDQFYPYNFYCKKLEKKDSIAVQSNMQFYKGRCVTGCAPLAVAQICSYYKKPLAYKGRNLDWDNVIANKRISYPTPENDNVLYFINAIGQAMDAKYGLSTSTKIDKTLTALHSIGYKNAKISTNVDDCIKSLANGEVVFMRGNASEVPNSGHAWVVDAHKDIQYTYRRYQKGSSTYSVSKIEHYHYLSFNWGFGSETHVYHFVGDPYDTGESAEWTDKNGNKHNCDLIYDTNFKYIVNIRQ